VASAAQRCASTVEKRELISGTAPTNAFGAVAATRKGATVASTTTQRCASTVEKRRLLSGTAPTKKFGAVCSGCNKKGGHGGVNHKHER
jgi:hypothetical protein